MTDETKKGETHDQKDRTQEAGGFSAIERLGRSFLEKNEQSQADLRALRDMHRRRTRTEPEDGGDQEAETLSDAPP